MRKKQYTSRKQFLDDVEKRFYTIMIGGIARTEDAFGYLWGHHKGDPTDTQLRFRELWEDLRTDILNHGNHQMRLAIEDIVKYLERIDKYEYKFVFYDKNKKTKE